jgi:hypothetical protein
MKSLVKEPATRRAVGEPDNSKSVRVYSSRRPSFAHCAVWAIVIGGHLLVILMLVCGEFQICRIDPSGFQVWSRLC